MPERREESPQSRRFLPRLIAFEVTRQCLLSCKHCRAAARAEPYPDELTTDECFRVLDNIASFAKPIMILTGGEPMMRKDIYDIASHAASLGMRVVMATCGALMDAESTAKIVAAGIKQISISLDGASAESHDAFRGVPGAFDMAIGGIRAAKEAGLSFQINTTICRHNLEELPDILELSRKLGASVFNPFMLVPTGRGKGLADQEPSPRQYETTLRWLAQRRKQGDINIRLTCAPHFQRIIRQIGAEQTSAHQVKGCMGGQSFAFISHRGKVQTCGFLEVECGDIRRENMDFRHIWDTSEVFLNLRNPKAYRGRCGRCEFAPVCGGCRARAYAATGDYLAEEPFCIYQPRPRGKKPAGGAQQQLDGPDRDILAIIQTDFPVARRPYGVLADRLGAVTAEVIKRISRMRNTGVIRRIGAVFDSASLGYVSTLVAARIPPERLSEVAAAVSELPEVTHNYRRDHAHNLWFTLTARSNERIEAVIAELKRLTGITDFHSLPASAVYKIRVDFAVNGHPQPLARAAAPPSAAIVPTDRQKHLVRSIQGDLPQGACPFEQLAGNIGWPVEHLIKQINDWLAAGVIRRFGAVVSHRRLGFTANGLAVFSARGDSADRAGRHIAKHRAVSHCYRREPLPDLPYNIFAMIHGYSKRQVRDIAAGLARELGLDDHEVLFSTFEYKKTSPSYFTEWPGQ
ncbi:MAG: radical SAM protein [Planctomycetes bacterium]|nr:radical SAM protein [Planctomycetota bacterium]